MEVLPALDLAGGRLARVGPGEPVQVEAFGGDPLAAAGSFLAAGARWIHLVDLDLAYRGEPANLHLVRELAALPARIQASGGVSDPGTVARLLEAGAARAVLGAAALADPRTVEEAVVRFGDRLVVGVEVEGGRVRPRGRAAGVDLPLEATLSWLGGIEPPRALVTAVRRVGGLGGPDVETVRAAAEALGCPVLAAGGIASIEHLRMVASVPGVEGAVVGRAALEGLLDLGAAVRALT